MRKLLSFLIILFLSCSSKKMPSLVGNWMPISVSFSNSMDNKVFTIYNRNNNEAIINAACKDYMLQPNEDSDIIPLDTLQYRKDLKQTYLNFDSSNLILLKDSTFHLNSFGLIVPTAVPGWHFGDKLIGKWKITQYQLFKMTVGDSLVNYSFFYEIVKHTNDTLIIDQTLEDGSQHLQTIVFLRK